ncbi:MAG: RNA polymerase sigma factor [Methyloglobulus sp.]|nr:RNA polymerase sigma factor [Methyloglobulus sp.]
MAKNAQADDVLNRVYLDCRPALQRYLAFSTRCPDTAADLVQEVYLRLPNLKPIPPSEAAIKAWLFRVAANLAVDHFRKEKRHQELLSEHLPVVDREKAVPTPETIAYHDDQLQKIQDALEILPTVCKEVLYLSRVEGLTHQAIAERLSISKSWVEKQLVRAINHLRQTISDE